MNGLNKHHVMCYLKMSKWNKEYLNKWPIKPKAGGKDFILFILLNYLYSMKTGDHSGVSLL